MKAVFVFTLLWASLLVELLTGQIGLPLLLAAMVIYYVSLVTSLGAGFAAAIGFGILTDLLYGRVLPVTAAILAAALLTGRLIRLSPPTHPLETALPGMGITLIGLVGGGVARFALSGQPGNFREFAWELIFFGALGLFVMPLLTVLFDAVGRKLGLAPAIGETKPSFDRLRPRRVREPRGEKPR